MTCKYCGRELVDGVCPVCSKKSVEERINDAYKNLGREMSGKVSVQEEERIKEERRKEQEEKRRLEQEAIQKEKAERESQREQAFVEISRQKAEVRRQKEEERRNGTRLTVGPYPWIVFIISMIVTVVIVLLTCSQVVSVGGGYQGGVYVGPHNEFVLMVMPAIANLLAGFLSSATLFFLVMVLVNLVKRKKD